MLPENQAFSWLILCPAAIVTNCLAALIVTHYRRAYIGTDMIIICLLLTMAMNAGLLLIPAIFVMLQIESWPHDFCLFYIWAFGFLRSMGLVGLFVLSFHWSYLSKMTPLHRVQTSSRPVICALIAIVLISVVVGLLPLIRMMMRESSGLEPSEDSGSVILLSSIFDEKRQVCAFLTYDAEPVMAIFIIILTLMVFLAMIICLTDSGILLHSYKIMFIVKYKSGGFYDPEQARSLWTQSGLVSDTYSEINNTFDLWRVVLLQFFLCTMLNHIPYVCIEFVQLFSRQVQKEVLMLTVQWLQVMEFTLFPLTLWMGGRYRHAFSHLCKRIFCCDDSSCEEENTCKLQSYRLKAHIKEQKQKAVEAMGTRRAQAKGRGTIMVKGPSLTALAQESDGASPQHDGTTTEVQADVHAQSTPGPRRGSTFQSGPAVRNSGPRISKGSPMVQRFARTLKEEAASVANATPLVNLVKSTSKSAEMGNTNNNNAAGVTEIRSSSPVVSESDSKMTTLDLYDDDDIDAVLDQPPLLIGSPTDEPRLEAIEMRNIEEEKRMKTPLVKPDIKITLAGSNDSKMPTPAAIKKPTVFPKPQTKTEVKIWTSQSKVRPPTPSGISFDCQGGSGPYFEPASESCSVTSEDVPQPKILQAEQLSKSKTPYVRSESFLQAVSSSSAYGTIPTKPSSKFKLFSTIAQMFQSLGLSSKRSKSAKLSNECDQQPNPEATGNKVGFGNDEKPGETVPRYTLKDRSAIDPNTNQFHVTHDELTSHEIIRKLHTFDSEDSGDEEYVDAPSSTDDMQLFAAAKKPKIKKVAPPNLKKSSNENGGKKAVRPMSGVINMAADLADKSPAEKRIKIETFSEPKIVKKLQSQNSSNGDSPAAASTPSPPPAPAQKSPEGTNADQEEKNDNALEIKLSPQVPKRIPPPKVIKKPVPPPPPPPPPPLPPPPPPPPSKTQQYMGSATPVSTNTPESPRSVKSEASGVLATGDKSRLLPDSVERQKRSSLITSDLLASHDIIKRLQNQAEKHSETLRRPYTRVKVTPAKPLLPPPLPPTPTSPKPTRPAVSKLNATAGLIASVTDSSDSGIGEPGTSGTEDEKPLIEDLLNPSSGRIYRSVSSESIFSHVDSECKEFPPSLSKATDDLRIGQLSTSSSTVSTMGSANWLTDTNSHMSPPNLKDTSRYSRSTSDISMNGHQNNTYRPPVPPRTIPVQKVKSLQATMLEREQAAFLINTYGKKDAKMLGSRNHKTVKSLNNTNAAKEEEATSSPKTLKKIEEKLTSETSAELRENHGGISTLKRSPFFMRRFHQELVARNLSDESTKPVFMSATAEKKSASGSRNNTPSTLKAADGVDDESPAALRKLISQGINERRPSVQPSVSSTSSSPNKTVQQDTKDEDSSTNNSEDNGHVDIKAAV